MRKILISYLMTLGLEIAVGAAVVYGGYIDDQEAHPEDRPKKPSKPHHNHSAHKHAP